jgi:hypothetical protein
MILDDGVSETIYILLLFCIFTVFIDTRLTLRSWRQRQYVHLRHRKTSRQTTRRHIPEESTFQIYTKFYTCMALQPFLGLWPLFQFLNSIQRLQDSLDEGWARHKVATCTQDSTNRINAHKHTCLEWDSNPLFHCLSSRRQFMPYTSLPPWSACTKLPK